MKRRSNLLPLCICLLWICAAYPAAAEEKRFSGELSTSVVSQYISRGYENSRDSIVVQPSLTLNYSDFSLNASGNLDTRPYSPSPETYCPTWTETDVTLSYTRAFGPLKAGLGYSYYNYRAPHSGGIQPPNSQEVFISAGLQTLLSPTLTITRDIDHSHQWYIQLAVTHSVELTEKVSLRLDASAAYLKSEYADAALFNAGGGYGGFPKFDDNYRATNEKFDNFHDGLIAATLPVRINPDMTFGPTIAYSFPLSGDARNEIKGTGLGANPAENRSSFLYGGVILTLGF